MCDYLTTRPHENLQFFLPNFKVVVFVYVPSHSLRDYFTQINLTLISQFRLSSIGAEFLEIL